MNVVSLCVEVLRLELLVTDLSGVASLTEQLSVLNTRGTGSIAGVYNVVSSGEDVINSNNDNWNEGGGGGGSGEMN